MLFGWIEDDSIVEIDNNSFLSMETIECSELFYFESLRRVEKPLSSIKFTN